MSSVPICNSKCAGNMSLQRESFLDFKKISTRPIGLESPELEPTRPSKLKSDLVKLEETESWVDIDSDTEIKSWRPGSFGSISVSSGVRPQAKTFYTTEAPRELVSFLYKLGHEAKEQSKSMKMRQLPDDIKVPDPVVWGHSIGSDMANGSFLSDPRNNQPGTSGFLSWVSSSLMGKELSDVGHDLIRAPSHDYTEEKEDVNFTGWIPAAKEANEKGWETQANEFPKWNICKQKSKSNNLPRIPDNEEIEPHSRYKRRRSISSDFVNSEANEISRIKVSSVRSPHDIKEFLSHGNNEDEDPNSSFIQILKGRLSCGSPRKIISKPMLRGLVKRNESFRKKFARVQWNSAVSSDKLNVQSMTFNNLSTPEQLLEETSWSEVSSDNPEAKAQDPNKR